MFCVSTSGIVPELSKPGMGLIFNSGTLPDTYFYWGFVRTGGLSLRWFKDMWLVTRVTAATTALSPKVLPRFLLALAAYSSSLTLRADTAKRRRQAGASST